MKMLIINQKLIIILSTLLLLAISCSKSKTDPVPQSPVAGFWQGSYTTNGLLGSNGFAILVKGDGSARVYEMGKSKDTTLLPAEYRGDGVWILNGNKLQVSYKANSLIGTTVTTVNEAFSSMTGTWALNGVVKGNITLNK